MEISGKSVFVSGGAAGIGLSIARAFAEAGAKVAIGDNRPEALQSVSADLARSYPDILPVHLDVTDPDSWETAARSTQERFGSVHILCNNAGVGPGRRPLVTISPEDWDWTMRINVGGIFLGTRAFVPRIKQTGEGGHIVNTSSILGLFATPLQGPYVASKFAAIGLSEVMRMELAEDSIGVSVLCPGVVKTELSLNSIKARPSGTGPLQAATATVESLRAVGQPVGMESGPIGQQVVDAVRHNRFYIMSHGEFASVVANRMQGILRDFGDSADTAYHEDISFLGGSSMALFGEGRTS